MPAQKVQKQIRNQVEVLVYKKPQIQTYTSAQLLEIVGPAQASSSGIPTYESGGAGMRA